MKSKSLILISFFGICFIFPGFGQNWEWTNQNTQKDASAWSYILDIDYQNNIYTGTRYGDSIFFGDTLFAHENFYDCANWAIAKYDNQGKFQCAIDINTLPDKTLFDLKLTCDYELNIYIAGEFQYLVNLLDTTIYCGDVPITDAPELFLAKVNPSMDIEWIRLISSPAQDECCGLAISNDNYIYLATSHHGNGISPNTVNYFDQDSTVHNYTICSLLKIDLEGNLIWRNELSAETTGISIRELNIDIFNNITLNGDLRDNLYYSINTLLHPNPGENQHRPFIIEIDPFGELISGKILDWDLVMADTDRDAFGNFYFAGFIWDTTYFGADTLTRHEDSTVNIITKLNSNYEPIWYETASAKSEQGSYYFHIDLDEDTLFFAGRCRGAFPMFDTVFNIGGYEALIGQVTPTGILDKVTITESTGGFEPDALKLDNCNNLLISGKFKGSAYFGQETNVSYDPGIWDGITVKLNRYEPNYIDFGPDTTVCESIMLVGPEGYQYYYWNDTLSVQNWLNITESGEYILACTNDEGCWIKDTIKITIQPGITINLGQDTIISHQDTIILTVPNIYESYLWSTGSIENSIEITGNTFGPGTWDIWVKVMQGACTVVDSIQLTITISVPELQDIGVKIYPNPTCDLLYVYSIKAIEKIELINFNGQIIYSKQKHELLNRPLRVDISDRPAGVYYIRIYLNDLIGNGKIIKL